jgi:hypothetical protein
MVNTAGGSVPSLVTVTSTAFDSTPVEFRTCSGTTVGCASALPPTCAANVSELTRVVGTVVPLNVTADCASKFAPFTVSVTLGVPAVTTCGETPLIVGLTSETTLNPDPQPPHARTMPTPKANVFRKAFTGTPGTDGSSPACGYMNPALPHNGLRPVHQRESDSLIAQESAKADPSQRPPATFSLRPDIDFRAAW